jgi:hypothetical protein
MTRFTTFLIVAALVTQAYPTASAAEQAAKLHFAQTDRAVVITMTVEIDDTPYLLWTHAAVHSNEIDMGPPVGVAGRIGKPEVDLYYYVFQNRDDPALMDGSRKKTRRVVVTWRLAGHRREKDEVYRVIREFTPSAKELKELLPKLQGLVKETERRMQSGGFTP